MTEGNYSNVGHRGPVYKGLGAMNPYDNLSTGYPLQSPVSPSIPLPCVTVCHHISTGLYINVDRVGVYVSSHGGATKNSYSKDFDSFFTDFVVAIIHY
jgi:hypothetical protein